MAGQRGRSQLGNSVSVIPSGPGAPRLPRTWFQARCMLAGWTTAAIKVSGSAFKVCGSADAVAARPVRDIEPKVALVAAGLPRVEAVE